MAKPWPIGQRVLYLKGNMSYRKFEKAIFNKTGKRIPHSTLHHLVSEPRKGTHKDTLEVLAEYADKPVEWFYGIEPGLDDPTTRALAKYLAPRKDKTRRELLDMLMAAGRKVSPERLNALATLAEAVVKDGKDN